jgi:hypothetical protein
MCLCAERALVILQNIFEEGAPLQNYAPFNPHAVINLRCFHSLVIGNPSVRNSKQNIARSPVRILSHSVGARNSLSNQVSIGSSR